MTGYASKRQMAMDKAMNRPLESDYNSQVAYTRALEAYCDSLAQPEQDNAYGYASRLATAIWQKHYMKDAPKWEPLDSIEGVLSQIDNMTCGLVKEKPLQPEPEQEPVAWISHNAGLYHFKPDESLDPMPLYTTPPKRPWVGLTAQEAADCWTTSATKTWHNFESKLKEKNYG